MMVRVAGESSLQAAIRDELGSGTGDITCMKPQIRLKDEPASEC